LTVTESPGTRNRWQTATIRHVSRKTPNVICLFLDTDIGPYLAGQHVDVRLTAPDGYQAERSYSISSAPAAGEIELTVERLDDGEVSTYFHDVAEPGDTFELRGPIGGHFIWEQQDGGPLLLVAGGSGIAPLMSILRHRKNVCSSVPTLLVYSSRGWSGVIFRDELLEMEASDPGLTIIFAITGGHPVRQQDLARRLDDDALGGILTDWGQVPRHAYVCGSNRFVEAAATGLINAGVPAEIIRTERYGGAD
jgi:ferredoxin-NADP reductase